MLRRFRPRLSFANVVSMLALFVALGGTGYAATQLAKNSVGSKQLRKNSVTSKKVRDFSLRRRDFAPGQVPSGLRGPAGPPGARGKTGKSGTARAYGAISAGGTLDANVQRNVSSVSHSPGSGVYCILPRTSINVGTTGVNATVVTGGTAAALAYWDRDKPSCPAGYFEIHTARVVSPAAPGDPATEAPADEPFFFSVP